MRASLNPEHRAKVKSDSLAPAAPFGASRTRVSRLCRLKALQTA
ncbi:TPA: hypothetical protein ACFM6R_000015 [Neisseria meningitidis]